VSWLHTGVKFTRIQAKQEHLQAILQANQGTALKSLGERRLATGHDLRGIPFHIEVDIDLVERMLGELHHAATAISNGNWNIPGSLAEEVQEQPFIINRHLIKIRKFVKLELMWRSGI